MCKFKHADFANLSVDGGTMRTTLDLAALFVYPLANLASAKVIEMRAS